MLKFIFTYLVFNITFCFSSTIQLSDLENRKEKISGLIEHTLKYIDFEKEYHKDILEKKTYINNLNLNGFQINIDSSNIIKKKLKALSEKTDQLITHHNQYKICKNGFSKTQISEKITPLKFLDQQINFSTQLIFLYEKLNDSFISEVNTLLCNFLTGRLEFIFQRQQYILEKDIKGHVIPSTNPLHFNSLTELEKILATLSTNRYQLFNYRIKHLYEILGNRDISVENRYYIRLSPTLWDILRGDTINLGYPDEPIDPEIIKNSKNGSFPVEVFLKFFDNKKSAKDLMYYKFYAEPMREIKCLELRGEEDLITPMNFPLTWYAYFLSEASERSINECEIKKKIKLNIKPLPYPEFLDPYFNYLSHTNKIEEKTENLVTLIDEVHNEQTSPNEEKKEDFSESNIISSNSPIFELGDNQKKTEQSEKITQNFPSFELNNAFSKEELYQKKLHQRYLKKKTNQEKKSVNVLNQTNIINSNYLPPSGIRKFHPQGMKQIFIPKIKNLKELNSTQINTYENIFDLKKWKNVSYGDFKALWKAINGEVSVDESSGSSHKTLLDSKNNVVTGIFAHGDNMKYSKKTIVYLRDALQRSGFNS